jgi:hypothetical protein
MSFQAQPEAVDRLIPELAFRVAERGANPSTISTLAPPTAAVSRSSVGGLLSGVVTRAPLHGTAMIVTHIAYGSQACFLGVVVQDLIHAPFLLGGAVPGQARFR